MSNTLPIALTRLSEHISTINFGLKKIDPYDHYAACWVTKLVGDVTNLQQPSWDYLLL